MPTTDEYGVEYCFTSNVFGVPFNELRGSCKESFAFDQSRATRLFHVPWTRRLDAVQELVGYIVVVGGSIVRFGSARYPDAPRLRCRNVDIEPFGGDRSVLTFGDLFQPIYKTGALLTATYESPKTVDEAEPEQFTSTTAAQEIALVTEQHDFSAEFLTLPENTFKYRETVGESPQLIKDTTFGKLLPQVEISHTRHFVPIIPEDTINDLLGKVNNASFPPTTNAFGNSRGRAAGTLLFIGAGARRVSTVNGIGVWEIMCKFLYRPSKIRTTGGVNDAGTTINTAGQFAGWNRIFMPKIGDWRKPLTNSGEREIYEDGDFTRLYEPNAT